MKEFDAASLGALATEARNAASERLDELSTAEMLGVMHAADREVVDAVSGGDSSHCCSGRRYCRANRERR